MITSHPQSVLAQWLCDKIGLWPTAGLRVLGRISPISGNILAVIGYDNWNGAACEMHIAGNGNWMSRELLFKAFDYPFNTAKCRLVLGRVPSGNIEAIRLNRHLGFKPETTIEGAHPDGALVIMSMRREECRWLNLKEHRHEKSGTSLPVRRAASAATA